MRIGSEKDIYKREEVTGEWRKLHTEKLNDLYSSPNICVIKSRRLRWAEHVARMGKRRGVYRVLVAKPEGNRTHGRTAPRREDNIKMDLHRKGCGSMAWMELAQNRDSWRALENAVMNLRVL
jgi:hypothetical protein